MIPALFWVDGWGWLYEMVLSGRYTQQPGQPVLGEPPCGHGETVMVSVDSHGPAALCSGSFTPICSGLRVSSGLTGVLGLRQPCTPVPAPFPWSHGAPQRG